MVSVFDFGLKKVLLVEKENELCVCEEFIVQHLLEHIQGLSQPICVGIFPKHLKSELHFLTYSKRSC